ncbi:MAG: YigZ family protein [Ignavibacteriota bacterium]
MPIDPDYYLTVESTFRASEMKEKSSRFIGEIHPAASKAEVESILHQIRTEFYDASHHCYAYRLGILGDQLRAADDGEPSGTAGKPILLALNSKQLTNCLLIVTRYYGGTKLGTGGLARAYLEAANLAVSGSKVIAVYQTDSIWLQLQYEELAILEKLLGNYEIQDRSSSFGEKIEMLITIRKSLSEKIKQDIRDKFYGKILLSDSPTLSAS